MSVAVLIPAHDEAGSIADTIRAVLAQTRLADRVIVIPNGCTDDTATIARSFPVEVMELPALPHRKSQALNTAWEQVQEYDMIVCLDADTILPPNAIQDWVEEMEKNPTVGGSSSKFTMQQPGILSRLQKAEFATWTQSSLDNGFTTVLAGTGCAVRGEALRRVAAINSLEPEEAAWRRRASSGRATARKTATDMLARMGATGLLTDSPGPKPMAQSPMGKSSDIGVTTRPVSDSITSNSERRPTTCETGTPEALGPGTLERRTASAAESTHIPTRPGDASAGRVTPAGNASIAPVVGPWSYQSATEDFTLTYRIRQLGYACQVSPSVRAYTDSMRTVRALWGQRIKWQVGTVEDLLAFGLNRLTWRDWAQQAMCLFNVFSKAFLVWFWAYLTVTGQITFIWFWWVFPLLFVGMEYVRYRSIPHRDKKDLAIALSFFPNEAFQWMRAAWVAASWVTVLSGRKRDLWAAQAKAEGHTVTTA